MTSEDAVLRFEENLEAIKRLWAEDAVDMMGSHFELMGARCPVKPVQRPRPPIWFGANADAAVRRAARLADAWYINPHVRLATVERQLDVYKRALDDADKPFPEELPIIREVFVGPTHDKALELCRPALETKYKAYHQWGQDKVMPEGDDDLDLDFDELTRDRFLLGSPDEVTEQILDMVRRTGGNHLVMGIQFPGMSQAVVLDSMRLLSAEVFPRVRQGI
jgi:alkanesulfonate monooxygenase SsuD/methylene tetrahydromethanopterin reductase-like flavin-dependent oxidoreductase (luciferase family)